MSLKGGLSNSEFRDVLANNNLHKYYEEGKITLEEYNRLQAFCKKMQSQSQENEIEILFDEPKRKPKAALIIVAILIIVGIVCIISAFAHPGKTDSAGGHRDNKNTSGLGGYHYHCGGYPAHLHTNGTCPYKTPSSNTTTSYQTTSPTGTYDEGYEVGYEEGYDEGYAVGSEEGNSEGYNTGHDDGYDEGYSKGYDEGYKEGKEKGYEEGYKARIKEASAERKKEYRALLILIIAIILIVQFVKLIKRYRASKASKCERGDADEK